MIEVRNLTKKYGNHVAVDNLSFTVPKGQILGFLGPNGAGKSTTMNMITGYISATDGTVIVNGHDVYEEPEEVKKCIGYLPEQPPVYPDMTVKEYLGFVADIKKVEKGKKKQMIEDIMESTKITHMQNRLIRFLSKGYKQRVGLAQAIVGYPEVIILDEPTVGLDPMQIIEIRDLIKELSKNHTIILSSHIMQEVSAVCNQIMIINHGKLVVTDKSEDLTKHFGATCQIEMLIRGEEPKVREVLSQISGIEQIKITNADETGLIHCIITSDEHIDLRETLFFTFSKAQIPVLEQKRLVMNLENIFLKVTNGEEIASGTKIIQDEKIAEENYQRDISEEENHHVSSL